MKIAILTYSSRGDIQPFIALVCGLQKKACPSSLPRRPNILPRPSDWDEHVHVAGCFFLNDEAYHPPNALFDFLTAG